MAEHSTQDSIANFGTVDNMAGSVVVVRADGTRHPVSPDTRIGPGDTIETGDGAAITVTFGDGTTLILAANGLALFEGLVIDAGQVNLALSVQAGNFLLSAGQSPDGAPSEVKIDTPGGKILAMGATVLAALPLNAPTAITLVPNPNGSVGVVQVSNGGGDQLLLRPLNSTTIGADGRPPAPVHNVAPDELTGLYGATATELVQNSLSLTAGGTSATGSETGLSSASASFSSGLESGGGGGSDGVLGSLHGGGGSGSFSLAALSGGIAIGSGTADTTNTATGSNDEPARIFPQVDALNSENSLQDNDNWVGVYFSDRQDQLGNWGGRYFQQVTLSLREVTITQLSDDNWVTTLDNRYVYTQTLADNFFSGGTVSGAPASPDLVSYANESLPVTVDLAAGTATFDGIDFTTLDDVEHVLGTGTDDILRGDDADGQDIEFFGTLYQSRIANKLFDNDGNDTIEGGAGNDILSGDFGNDTLSGDSGNDYLFGDDPYWEVSPQIGADTLDGGAGDDFLAGGQGSDILRGGEDDDSYIFSLGQGRDTIWDESGYDRLGFMGTLFQSNDVGGPVPVASVISTIFYTRPELFFTAIDMTVTLDIGAESFLTLDMPIGEPGNGIDIQLTNAAIAGSDGTIEEFHFRNLVDEPIGHFATRYTTAASTAGNDFYVGDDTANRVDPSAGKDVLYGNGGADTLEGGAARDFLSGGTGNDSLAGGTGDDFLRGGAGDDHIDGGDGSDWLDFFRADLGVHVDFTTGTATDPTGGADTIAAIENIRGTDGDDDLSGDDSDNEFHGFDGDDRLSGGGGTDFLWGYAGDDTLIGGDGDDALITDGANNVLDGGAGDDYLLGSGILNGGAGNDSLIGGGSLDGGAGNDTLVGRGSGIDILRGGDDDDILVWKGGGDVIDGGAGIDTLFATGTINLATQSAAVSDGTTLTLSDIENLIGTHDPSSTPVGGDHWDDHFTGTDGDNLLRGMAGADQLHGGGGNDTLSTAMSSLSEGHVGAVYRGSGTATGIDTIADASGTADALGFRVLENHYVVNPGDLRFNRVGADLEIRDTAVTGDSGLDIVEHFGDGTIEYFLFEGLTEDADVIRLFAWTETATADNDLMVGGDGVETLDGGGGFDILYGGGGADELLGGADDDILIADGGNDSLSGGTGVDTFVITGDTAGADVIVGDLSDGETIDIAGLLAALGLTSADVATAHGGGNTTLTIGNGGPLTTILIEGVDITTFALDPLDTGGL